MHAVGNVLGFDILTVKFLLSEKSNQKKLLFTDCASSHNDMKGPTVKIRYKMSPGERVDLVSKETPCMWMNDESNIVLIV